MTDARSAGLGFVLQQQQHGYTWHIVQASSRFLSDTKSRYAAIKEMLGVSWAITKCHKLLAGLSYFDIIIDHSPLLAILNNRSLDEIEIRDYRDCVKAN